MEQTSDGTDKNKNRAKINTKIETDENTNRAKEEIKTQTNKDGT